MSTQADLAPGVLVTRPRGAASAHLCARLEAAGYRAYSEPMLVLEPLQKLAPAALDSLRSLDSYDIVVFISANAVSIGFEFIDGQWPHLPQNIEWCAVGSATAALLSDRGLSVHAPTNTMTSEGLLALPVMREVDGARILIVKGEGGRGTLRDELGSRGALVDELVCYRRRSPQLPPGLLAARLEACNIDVVLFSSGDGIVNFARLLSPAETTTLNDIRVVTPSERAAEVAKQHGFSHITIAENATDDAMLLALDAEQAQRRQLSGDS